MWYSCTAYMTCGSSSPTFARRPLKLLPISLFPHTGGCDLPMEQTANGYIYIYTGYIYIYAHTYIIYTWQRSRSTCIDLTPSAATLLYLHIYTYGYPGVQPTRNTVLHSRVTSLRFRLSLLASLPPVGGSIHE